MTAILTCSGAQLRGRIATSSPHFPSHLTCKFSVRLFTTIEVEDEGEHGEAEAEEGEPEEAGEEVEAEEDG